MEPPLDPLGASPNNPEALCFRKQKKDDLPEKAILNLSHVLYRLRDPTYGTSPKTHSITLDTCSEFDSVPPRNPPSAQLARGLQTMGSSSYSAPMDESLTYSPSPGGKK